MDLTGEEFGTGLSRRELALAADRLLRELQHGDGLLNDDTGWLLHINRKGRNKMGDNADLSAAESKAVAGIGSLTRHAVLAETHHDIEHNNPQVFSVHRLYVPVNIAGTIYRVKLTAKTFVPELGRGAFYMPWPPPK